MTNCENFTNEDIKNACEDIHSMDDEQKIQRMYELIKDLDAEYDSISATLGEESNTMGKELLNLTTFLLDHIKSLNVKEEQNLFWKSYCLHHMIVDFVVDWTISEDIFAKYNEYNIMRNEYLNELKKDIPKVEIFPNPAKDAVNISIQHKYWFFENKLIVNQFTVWVPQDITFDPYIYLPKKIENSNFDINNLQADYTFWEVFDNNWVFQSRFRLNMDTNWNIQWWLDTSKMNNWIYHIRVVRPSPYDSTLELEDIGIGRDFVLWKLVVQH